MTAVFELKIVRILQDYAGVNEMFGGPEKGRFLVDQVIIDVSYSSRASLAMRSAISLSVLSTCMNSATIPECFIEFNIFLISH